MLERYGFFKHLGFFGVEQGIDARCAHLSAHDAQRLSPRRRNAGWLTPQGRFMDVRERPLRLQDGLGALAARKPDAAFIPLAIEYAFWTEPRPEILVSFGEPIDSGDEPNRSADEWTQHLRRRARMHAGRTRGPILPARRADWLVLNRGKPLA